MKSMRSSVVAALLLAVGCGRGVTGGSGPGVAVMPNMTELPGDPGKRDAVLNQSNARPDPEHSRQHLSPKLRRVETTAATAAAIIGDIFSTTKNVVFGTGGSFDENAIIDGQPQPVPQPVHQPASDDGAKDYDSGQLVPWVKLPASEDAKPQPQPQPEEKRVDAGFRWTSRGPVRRAIAAGGGSEVIQVMRRPTPGTSVRLRAALWRGIRGAPPQPDHM